MSRKRATSSPALTVRQNLLLGEKPGNGGVRWTMSDMFRLFPGWRSGRTRQAACCPAASRRCWRCAER